MNVIYSSTQKKRILVVEDETMIRNVLCILLQHSDFEVQGVPGGQEAIQIIPEFNPHLIILDLLMQPISGWDVLHWLRVNQWTPRTPVIVVSALVYLREQMHGFEEGAIEYIPKPIQPSMLIARVRTLLAMTIEQRQNLHRRYMDERRTILLRLAQFSDFVY